MIKRIFIDTETGGLESKTDGLIQVAGLIDIDGEVQDTFNFEMKPPEGKIINNRALEVNGYDVDILNGFPTSKEVFKNFTALLDKYINKYGRRDKATFLAYNSPFDTGFIRQWFKDNGNNFYGSYFFRYAIDIAGIAMEALIEKRPDMPNDKLETVIKYLNIKPSGDLHDALVDITASREAYYKSLQLLAGHSQAEIFND